MKKRIENFVLKLVYLFGVLVIFCSVATAQENLHFSSIAHIEDETTYDLEMVIIQAATITAREQSWRFFKIDDVVVRGGQDQASGQSHISCDSFCFYRSTEAENNLNGRRLDRNDVVFSGTITRELEGHKQRQFSRHVYSTMSATLNENQ